MLVKQAYSIVLKDAVRVKNSTLIKVIMNSNVVGNEVLKVIFYDACLNRNYNDIKFLLNEPSLKLRHNLRTIVNDIEDIPKCDKTLDKVLSYLKEELEER